MRSMGRKSKYKPEIFGSLSRLNKEDEEELRDAIEYEYNKAEKWKEKYFDLYRKVSLARTKKQMDLL